MNVRAAIPLSIGCLTGTCITTTLGHYLDRTSSFILVLSSIDRVVSGCAVREEYSVTGPEIRLRSTDDGNGGQDDVPGGKVNATSTVAV